MSFARATRRAQMRIHSAIDAHMIQQTRCFASAVSASPVASTGYTHKVVVIGVGSAGLTASHQLLRSGNLAGLSSAAALKNKEDLRKPLKSLIDPKLKLYNERVNTLSPEDNSISLGCGTKLNYDQLVVVPGISINPAAISGLPEALADPSSTVSSTYGYDYCDQVFSNITKFKSGTAIFTHPASVVKNSVLTNEAGFVDVDQVTLRHKMFSNVWSIGDASSLPTSKTAAAITAQAPVLVQNLLQSMQEKQLEASYNGYTSCPLLTQYGKVMLAEFKYGGEPQETFGWLSVDQAVPRRAFYHLKKDFFPWVYFKSMVKGTWAGPKGWMK